MNDFKIKIKDSASIDQMSSIFYEVLKLFKEFNTKESQENFITAYNKKQIAVLSEDERQAIHDYGANSYGYLNEYLRNGVLPTKEISLKKDDPRVRWLESYNIHFEKHRSGYSRILDKKEFIEQYVKILNTAIKKTAIPKSITAYRMVVAEEYESAKKQIGKTFTTKSFLSTTLIRENAINSGNSLKIFLPKGTKAAGCIGGLMLQEMELTLPIGTRLKVLGEKEVVYPRGHIFWWKGKPATPPKMLELEVII